MIEEGTLIIRSPRRLDEVAFGADLNSVRDIARILGQGAKLRENRTHRPKVMLRLFVDDITIHYSLPSKAHPNVFLIIRIYRFESVHIFLDRD
jgi:hypothetical protein